MRVSPAAAVHAHVQHVPFLVLVLLSCAAPLPVLFLHNAATQVLEVTCWPAPAFKLGSRGSALQCLAKHILPVQLLNCAPPLPLSAVQALQRSLDKAAALELQHAREHKHIFRKIKPGSQKQKQQQQQGAGEAAAAAAAGEKGGKQKKKAKLSFQLEDDEDQE